MKGSRSRKRLALILCVAMVLCALAPSGVAQAAKKQYKDYTNGYGKAGVTRTTTGLRQLLASEGHAYILLKNVVGGERYSIPAGDYSDKRIGVNAPDSSVVNRGTFKSVKINALKESYSWYEYAKGNSFSIVDPEINMFVKEGAEVNKLYFKAPEGKVTLTVDGDVAKTGFYGENMEADILLSSGTTKQLRVAGKDSDVKVETRKGSTVETVKIVEDAKVSLEANSEVREIVLDSPADVTITGNTEKLIVTATEKAGGAKVETSVPVETSVASKVELTLKEGAEGSTVTKADEKVEVAVKNGTSEKVEVATEGSEEKEAVESGGSKGDFTEDGKTDDGTTEDDKKDDSSSGSGGSSGGYYPAPDPTVNVTGISLDPTSAEIKKGQTVKLTATVTPDNATNKTVTWKSDNTEIATVANGVVTGVSAGAVTISAVTVDGNKTATCKVTVLNVDFAPVVQVKIGEVTTGYETLPEAVKAANDATAAATVTLLNDVTLDATVNFQKNKNGITLDLNGKTISGSINGDGALINIGHTSALTGTSSTAIAPGYSENRTSVTITDTSAEGTKGTIKNTSKTNRILQVTYLSSLTLDGGIHIAYNKAENEGSQSAVLVRGDQRRVDEGKPVAANETMLTVRNATIDKTTFGVSAYGPVTVNIEEGAMIKSEPAEANDPSYAVGGNGLWKEPGIDNGGTIININGGIIDGGAYNTGIYQPQNGVLNIKGGQISGISGIDVKSGTVNISGNAVISSSAIAASTQGATGSLLPVRDGANAVDCSLAVVERADYYGKVNVTITGGTFKGAVRMLRKTENPGGNGTYTISATAGSFSPAPDQNDYQGGTPYTMTGSGSNFTIKKTDKTP